MYRLLPALFLSLLLLAACGDDAGDDTVTPDDTGATTTTGDGDADTTTTGGDGDTTGDDTTTTGGDGDGDTTTGGDGDGDGTGLGKAANLGVPCPTGMCPNGETCIAVQVDDDMNPSTPPVQITGQFCTVSCEGQMDMTSCADGFPGPGIPVCALGSATGSSCAVVCDTDAAPDCPTGNECIALGNGTRGICGPPAP